MPDEPNEAIEIDFYSDVLCVWAYLGCRRVTQLAETFGTRIRIRTRFCSVFSDVPTKIAESWKVRGGYEGYASHVREVAAGFPHATVGQGAWSTARPVSSAPAHLFLRAVHIAEAQSTGQDPDTTPYLGRCMTRVAWLVRTAFFEQGRDISNWRVLREIAEQSDIDPARIWNPEIQALSAAALARDFDLTRKQNVEGSPTFILNSGRQRLFGNVGYRLLAANVEELLRRRRGDEASWC